MDIFTTASVKNLIKSLTQSFYNIDIDTIKTIAIFFNIVYFNKISLNILFVMLLGTKIALKE